MRSLRCFGRRIRKHLKVLTRHGVFAAEADRQSQGGRRTTGSQRDSVSVRRVLLIGCLTAAVLATSATAQTITGTVFSDPDADGIRDSGELGFAGVVVSAYGVTGSLAAQTAACGTAAIAIPANPPGIPSPINVAACAVGSVGSYTLSGLTVSADYRVEFTWNDPLLFAGAEGSESLGAVRFATEGATGVNQGVNYPEDYCQNNPRIIAGCYVFPPPFNVLPPWDPSRTDQLISSWLYSSRFTTATNAEIHPHDADADYGDLGHVLGVTVHRSTRKVFFGAIASPTWDDGALGMGGIYTADYTGTDDAFVPGSVTEFVDLNGDDALPGDDLVDLTNQFPVTAGVLDRFGEQGLGGVDFSADDEILWAVNMGNGRLIRMVVGDPPVAPGAAEISEVDITGHGCSNGRFRPGAVEVHRGNVFVGGVCDASGGSSTDLRVVVLEYDGASFTSRLSAPFDFQTNQIFPLASFGMAEWSNIDSATAPQPFLTNLAFDDDGSLILGLMPRVMYNAFAQTSGWLLRAQVDAGGSFALESGGVSGPYTSTARSAWTGSGFTPANPPLSEGPGGGYFFENGIFSGAFALPPFDPPNSATYHSTLFSSGLTVVSGTGEIAAGFTDPLSINAFGVRYLDRDNGRAVAGVQFGGIKVSLVSDVDAICQTSPLEIGNRVWCDTDGNGVQDPGETGPAGVDVVLTCGADSPVTATTSADGRYLFTDALYGSVNGGGVIPRGGSCTVSVATVGANGTTIAGACGTVNPSPLDAGGADDGGDLRDSDGMGAVSAVVASVAIGDNGENQHTIDFGFTALIAVTGSIGDTVWCDGLEGTGNGSFDMGEGLADVTVNLFDDPDCDNSPDGGAISTQMTLGDGQYLFPGLTVGAPGSPVCYVVQVDGADSDLGACDSAVTAVEFAPDLDSVGLNSLTNDFGFEEPLGSGSIGDTVWCDGLETTGNGSFDMGEGLADVTVNLFDDPDCDNSPDGGAVSSAMTAGDGQYLFSGLTVGAPGSPVCYVVQVDGADADLGACDSAITAVEFAPDLDSDSPNSLTNDFGFEEPLGTGSIGDTVWCDGLQGLGNGSFDTGEGVAGVRVDLFNDPDCNNTPDGGVVGTQMTVGDGQYLFSSLAVGPPGSPVCYVIRVDSADPDLGTCDIAITAIEFAPDLENSNPHSLINDFGFEIMSLDLGDAPETEGYPTLIASNGARHVVLPVGNPVLGAGVDIESDGQPDPNHMGDDSDGSDDEDGVTLGGIFIPGAASDLTLTTGGTGGLVSAWIDWNLDGDWNDADEQIIDDLAVASNASQVVSVLAPLAAQEGTSCARFRIASAGGLTPTGLAPDGEVEDHGVAIISEDPAIGVSKELISITEVSPGEFVALFLITLSNSGNVALSSLQAQSSLMDAFAEAVDWELDLLTSPELSVNPDFDGLGDINLLTGSDILEVGGLGSIELQVVVRPGNNNGPYLCSAAATGTSPAGVEVEDMSQDGTDNDPDNDGDPTNNNDPTPIIFPAPPIEIPTLGEWSLLLFAFLILAFGLFRVRGTVDHVHSEMLTCFEEPVWPPVGATREPTE